MSMQERGSIKRLNEKDILNALEQNIEEEVNNKPTSVIFKQPNVIQLEASDNEEDNDDDSVDMEFIKKFSSLIQTNNQQDSLLFSNSSEIVTKKLLKKANSIYDNEYGDDTIKSEQEASNTKATYMIEESPSSDSDDDDQVIMSLQQQSNLSVKYLNYLKEINDEGYISITIQSVIESESIPNEYWSVFQSVVTNDPIFVEKNLKNKYTVRYLKVKLKNNKDLEEKLNSVEIGLLLVGSILNEVQYDPEDQANFLGQFKYEQIKFQDQQASVHLFFSILHTNETQNRQYNAIQDFFSNSNVIVLEPDYMLYPTLIAQSVSCYRTPLIKMKFCVTESTNWNMLKGSILHDIFEYLMELHKKNDTDLFINQNSQSLFFQSIIRNLYTKYIEDLFLLGKSIEEFEKDIKYIAKNMFDFVSHYLINGDYYFSKGSKRNIKILKLVENEMVVNNESLGLKGQIDCIFLCEVEETTTGEKYKCFLPFELKTGGKKKQIYEDQSLFYCLLLNQKYQHKKNLEGFLYYLSFNEIISLSPTKKMSQGLISRRNKVRNQNYPLLPISLLDSFYQTF